MSIIYFTVALLFYGKADYDLGDHWRVKAKYSYPKSGEVVIEYHTRF